jgi:hypothetical protein
MSIRLDPRRVNTLKQLAGDAGVRPGDLVREWVEERIDAVRQGVTTSAAAGDLASRLAELTARVAALETAAGIGPAPDTDRAADEPEPASQPDAAVEGAEPEHADAAAEAEADGDAEAGASEEPAADPVADGAADLRTEAPKGRRPVKRVAGMPSVDRVALHDEMIAVLSERGPMSAGELAAAIAERGRYAPPRSGKTLDAAMVSQRVSNPTYRSRFVRNEGRIGLAEQPGAERAE